MHIKKEILGVFLYMLSVVYKLYIYIYIYSRYSGICLLGNVNSEKTYRQLSEQASEQNGKNTV
jgi:hypothetical protein